ncbi:hypothetical protein L1987_60188 [Smallanthus sonchifolius]|uniref:Uncharacterized protein n=1 Tax=Smallanthus sonchifolius TaxID=185202 RepID=A0ACB9D7C1_9ASTR|nr:hypothetical protein L1987_60188 [Smallanthus sonchifolius]
MHTLICSLTDDETETANELGHEALVVEAQAADERGHEAPAAVEPIQSESIASARSTRPFREIRIVYTRKKRKPETGPSAEPVTKKAKEDVPSTIKISQSSRARHDLTTDGEPMDCSMKKKLDAESHNVEAVEAILVVAKQQMVTIGENVEAAVALATTCLMMFAVMICAGGIARFPY